METTLDTVGNDAKDTKDENKGSIVTAWNSDERKVFNTICNEDL